ncbi:hypothetical protein [Paraburkholderia sediminicola]|uniref:hypothetical protein n=1 Tax=Paraburkholderia sediminicola TaxID=458836 RepID=UPI0038B8536F
MSNRPFDPNDLTPVVEHPMQADYRGNDFANLSYGERTKYYAVRDRLDRALQANAVFPEYPNQGETPELYERRLTRSLMPHATTYAPMKLDRIPTDLFRDLQKTVLAEAMQAPARRGELVPIRSKDHVGREITEYEGSMSCWLNAYKAPGWRGPITINGVPQRF